MIPNGPGLLTAGQQGLMDKATGGAKTLFKGASEKLNPERAVAKEHLKELKVKPKIKATPNDLMKLAGASSLGFLMLNETMLKIAGLAGGEESKDKKKGLLDGLKEKMGEILGGKMPGGAALKGLIPKLLKGGAIVAIAAGVMMMVVDGIKGVFKAKQWGVSKISAGLGGFLGGTGSGIKGAFKNMGKWALVGAGTGFLIASLPGAIAGGLIGAAIGGILGFIGGKKLAKGFDKLGALGMKLWDNFTKSKLGDFVFSTLKALGDVILAPFKGLIEGIKGAFKLDKIWGGSGSFLSKIGASLVNIGEMIWSGLAGWFKGLGQGLKDFFVKAFVGPDSLIIKFGGAVKEWAAGFFNGLKEIWGGIWSAIKESDAFKSVSTFFTTYVIDPIKGFFSGIGDFFDQLKSYDGNFIKMGKDLLSGDFDKGLKAKKDQRDFLASEAYKKLLESQSYLRGGVDTKAKLAEQAFAAYQTTVHDGIFSLEKSFSRGALFQDKGRGIQFDKDDDLFLMASTNPARDALVKSVDRLNSLIGDLAVAIQAYQPQTNNLATTIESTHIPLRDLVARPGRV